MRRRTLIWLTVLVIVFLLILASKSVIGQGISYRQAPIILSTLSLIILFTLYLLTSRYDLWDINPEKVAYLGAGAGLYLGLAYFFTDTFPVNLGKFVLRPAVCIPILFGYAFGPTVGFFTGAVGSLLADFAIGWDVFPIWNLASGVTGLVPGFVTLFEEEKIPERTISTIVNLLLILTSVLVFLHPKAPEPWTGVIQDYSFWGYLLLIVTAIMAGNSYLMEQDRLNMISINLWGALGIILSTFLTSLADIWLNGFSAATALVGEYAPYTAIDTLNLLIFAPLIMAAYQFTRNRLPGFRQPGQEIP